MSTNVNWNVKVRGHLVDQLLQWQFWNLKVNNFGFFRISNHATCTFTNYYLRRKFRMRCREYTVINTCTTDCVIVWHEEKLSKQKVWLKLESEELPSASSSRRFPPLSHNWSHRISNVNKWQNVTHFKCNPFRAMFISRKRNEH